MTLVPHEELFMYYFPSNSDPPAFTIHIFLVNTFILRRFKKSLRSAKVLVFMLYIVII